MSSASRPEFFLDRSLGKETAGRLAAAGWAVHLLGDVYADDAQGVDDETWLAEGCRRGWALLSKDKRIRYRGAELAAMHDGRLFCLSSGNLTTAEMAARFLAAQARIERLLETSGRGFWQVTAGGRIVRKWP